jgi:hypothetical protein
MIYLINEASARKEENNKKPPNLSLPSPSPAPHIPTKKKKNKALPTKRSSLRQKQAAFLHSVLAALAQTPITLLAFRFKSQLGRGDEDCIPSTSSF